MRKVEAVYYENTKPRGRRRLFLHAYTHARPAVVLVSKQKERFSPT